MAIVLVDPYLYVHGRAVSYSALGFLMGTLGWALQSSGWQNVLSITAGLVLLSMLIFQWQKKTPFKPLQWLSHKIQDVFQLLFGKTHTLPLLFAFGLANGLLPCGLVYVALAASAAMGSPVHSALFMFAFGVGTWPMLLAARTLIKNLQPWRFKLVLTVLSFAVALLLIMRGLELGIPYVSPKFAHDANMQNANCH